MFNCNHHGWASFERICPECFPDTYTATDLTKEDQKDGLYDERDSVMANYREFDFNEAFTGFEIGHIKAVMDIYASKFHAGIIKNNNHD